MVVPTATGTRSSAAAQQEMTIDGAPLRSHVLLWAVALALGSVTAVGVWLFDQAIDLVGRVVRDVLVPALGPIGVWGIVPILALACLLVAGIVRFTRPEKLAAMGHIIDGVAEHEGHLDQHNAAVVVSGAAVGLGMGMPLGADTPSAMIGGLIFIVPALLAVAAAAITTFRLTGTPPVYAIPPDAVHWDASLALYLVPALVAAFAAVACVRLFPVLKATWARLAWPTWARRALAGAMVGVVAVALPDVTGSGTGTMKQLFSGATIPLATLVALAVAKLVLTPGSLGAGFVGGVIGPAMLIGSCLGAAVGAIVW